MKVVDAPFELPDELWHGLCVDGNHHNKRKRGGSQGRSKHCQGSKCTEFCEGGGVEKLTMVIEVMIMVTKNGNEGESLNISVPHNERILIHHGLPQIYETCILGNKTYAKNDSISLISCLVSSSRCWQCPQYLGQIDDRILSTFNTSWNWKYFKCPLD